MYFNSIDFAIFLPLVFIFYWFLTNKNLKLQNLLILLASYFFYGWWDWRFLFLIIFSTIIDFSIGLCLSKSNNLTRRKFLLWVSVVVNLGFLGFFKYYNFFIDNFIYAFSFFGTSIKSNTLNIILPVGISFYTFQTLSYTIDVYREKLKPTNDFIAFASFVSFFPQLVAGPIERATNLLPQFYSKRKFNYSNAMDGIRQIMWGLFKKIVIADNCAEYANIIFNNSTDYSGSTLILGAILFTFQIYGDFSGYSDIAIGTSRLFGFNLKQNFAFPYFSRDIAEFWRRWHISLSTWFRDYVYIPLGGSRGGIWQKLRNTLIIFVVSGFWHGANWTFIIWGTLNAIYFIPLLLTNRNRNNLGVAALGNNLPSIKEFISIIWTFSLTVFAWIFFRAENVHHALGYISKIFSSSFFEPFDVFPSYVFVMLFVFIIIEWIGRQGDYAIQFFYSKKEFLNYFLVTILLLSIYLLGNFQSKYDFIYFQF